jgi:hypothetical protein
LMLYCSRVILIGVAMTALLGAVPFAAAAPASLTLPGAATPSGQVHPGSCLAISNNLSDSIRVELAHPEKYAAVYWDMASKEFIGAALDDKNQLIRSADGRYIISAVTAPYAVKIAWRYAEGHGRVGQVAERAGCTRVWTAYVQRNN